MQSGEGVALVLDSPDWQPGSIEKTVEGMEFKIQLVWNLGDMLGSYMLCLAMHQLELLVDKIRSSFFNCLIHL